MEVGRRRKEESCKQVTRGQKRARGFSSSLFFFFFLFLLALVAFTLSLFHFRCTTASSFLPCPGVAARSPFRDGSSRRPRSGASPLVEAER